MSTFLGILVPELGDRPVPPEARPLGRAALLLAEEGIDLIFGGLARDGRLIGAIARPGRWEPAERLIVAAYDRFPSQSRPAAHGALLAGLPGVPVANPPEVVALCRDKLACQVHLEAAGIAMPEVEADAERFVERLQAWGTAFVKPRHGAFGRGVARLVRGDPVPRHVTGTVTDDQALLQRAVAPPAGFAGWCVRVLVQRGPRGWAAYTPVLRQSRTDPVVNAARGAHVAELTDSVLRNEVDAKALAVAHTFDHPLAVELGVDLVIDSTGAVWPIEVNGTPRGRLEWLAAAEPSRWAQAHVETCARPLRYLAARFAS